MEEKVKLIAEMKVILIAEMKAILLRLEELETDGLSKELLDRIWRNMWLYETDLENKKPKNYEDEKKRTT